MVKKELTGVFVRCLLLLLLVCSAGCKSDSPGQDRSPTIAKAPVPIPAFNRDSAFAYVAKQVSFGPRVVGSPGHAACRDWLVGKLDSWGYAVTEQEFTAELYTGDAPKGVNIITRINPQFDRRILLAAHWDTRHIADQDKDASRQGEPIPGADDGGSGVAVLLEIARTIKDNPVEIGVDIVLFDAEDHGESNGSNDSWCLGSKYWSQNVEPPKPEYGILLDMVGARGARFRRDGVSLRYAKPVADKVWDLAASMGYNNYFIKQDLRPFIDDHVFVNQIAQIPMIDICNRSVRGFGTHWHTHSDDIDIIDKSVMRVVGQVVLALLYKESTGHI